MPTPLMSEEHASRPSRVIAEALINRHGPRQITSQAAAMGLSRPLTQVILVACSAASLDARSISNKGVARAR